ncbi:aldehyde dehydrogenase family protein [Pseudomonas sp. H9]|uniref:aldehyde dehydrogenase family protein n=1 Tax=Pseudomonas sp. H9 TaxID=483968 RepID=UPI0010577A95|nr:aldehyde dehydrogenase family protein [Pseudomonas sp. H9]TDF83785.1 aldehyde dehydrogenase family protein [Pseudomonas sp. H9]
MHQLNQFYIDGQWVVPASGAEAIDIVNPATEAVIGTLAMGTEADVERAVAAARAAFPAWSATHREERLALLGRVIEVYQTRLGDIAQAIHEEIGAPQWLATERQAPLGLLALQSAMTALQDIEFSKRLGNTEVVSEPMGVAALITPWNWPIFTLAAKVAFALASGCTVVLKPSEFAPLDAKVFAEIMHEAGVPQGVFNMVFGAGPVVGAALASHPDVDVISLTGSTRAGVEVSSAAAKTVKRVLLELGGKSPMLILDDADLAAAVKDGVINVMVNSGQTCVAPSRMLVPRALQDQAKAIAATVVAAMPAGDPSDARYKVGPMANRPQFEKVQKMIGIGIEHGAEVVVGGSGLPEGVEQGYFVRPTVFANVTNDAVVAREEIFGPVLTMIPYDTEEEAIAMANDSPYGLAAYVWSGNPERARRVAGRLRAGVVRINGAMSDPRAPFGGYKQSGNGRELGVYGLHEYLEYKSIAL